MEDGPEVFLKSMKFENGQFDMAVTGPAMEHIAACVVGHFKALGPENYFEMSLFDREDPSERYVVTVQKVSAKSPHELRKAAEADVAEFMRRLDARWFLAQGWFPCTVSARIEPHHPDPKSEQN
jgi:hypothetical protein